MEITIPPNSREKTIKWKKILLDVAEKFHELLDENFLIRKISR